jgi:hypothetical protein
MPSISDCVASAEVTYLESTGNQALIIKGLFFPFLLRGRATRLESSLRPSTDFDYSGTHLRLISSFLFLLAKHYHEHHEPYLLQNYPKQIIMWGIKAGLFGFLFPFFFDARRPPTHP